MRYIYKCDVCGWIGEESFLCPGWYDDYDEYDCCPVCWENDGFLNLVDIIEYIEDDES